MRDRNRCSDLWGGCLQRPEREVEWNCNELSSQKMLVNRLWRCGEFTLVEGQRRLVGSWAAGMAGEAGRLWMAELTVVRSRDLFSVKCIMKKGDMIQLMFLKGFSLCRQTYSVTFTKNYSLSWENSKIEFSINMLNKHKYGLWLTCY